MYDHASHRHFVCDLPVWLVQHSLCFVPVLQAHWEKIQVHMTTQLTELVTTLQMGYRMNGNAHVVNQKHPGYWLQTF